MEQMTSGGFTAFRKAKESEKELFTKMIGTITGVKYELLAVATQVVNGTNYAFLCESKLMYKDDISYNTFVIVHQPLPQVNEPPMIKEIRRVKLI